ncbi:hypothetical protein VM98_39345, partial [Streptomyces rubellomurinus subsp. indigoferus]
RVLRPKAAAAAHLHHLTQHHQLSAFALYSSAAGVLATAAQPGYPAATAYLAAHAHHRRTRGPPATSLAWGLWAERTALTRRLSPADRQRLARAGLLPFGT